MNNKNHLSIDIYNDKYPKPILKDNVETVLVIQKPIPNEEINSPKYIPQQTTNTSVQNTSVQNTSDNHKGICVLILSTLVCICIGIACILIALEENEPSEEHMIYLEGQIVYVFYLGAGIIMCVMFCLFGACCVRCCGDLCILFI